MQLSGGPTTTRSYVVALLGQDFGQASGIQVSTDGDQVIAGIVTLDVAGQRAGDAGANLLPGIRAQVQFVDPAFPNDIVSIAPATVRQRTQALAAIAANTTRDASWFDLEVTVDLRAVETIEIAQI